MRKSLAKLFWNIEVWAEQKHVNLVDLVKSFPTSIYLQNLASIQKRTSPAKFAHLAENSGKGSISNLSTKAPPPKRGRRGPVKGTVCVHIFAWTLRVDCFGLRAVRVDEFVRHWWIEAPMNWGTDEFVASSSPQWHACRTVLLGTASRVECFRLLYSTLFEGLAARGVAHKKEEK